MQRNKLYKPTNDNTDHKATFIITQHKMYPSD